MKISETICPANHSNEAVNEALDNPYPFNLTGPNDSQEFAAIAKTPNGELRMDFETTDYDNFSIDFAVGKSMGKTEAGDEFRVFATVVAMMNKWISTVGIESVESIDFGANKGEHASDGRAKLYTRFAKKLASQLGWKLEQSTTSNRSTEFFRLTNPKPVPRDDAYFDALEDGNLGPNGEIPAQYTESVKEEVEVSLYGDAEKGYTLSKIEVSGDERNAGQGTKAMQDIVDRMDREGAIIALTPDDAFGGNKNRLFKFYKRFGFVPNKGRNKDFRFRETMIRYPQTNEAVSDGHQAEEKDARVTQLQLNALEKVLDRVFGNVGIDVEFTRHFLDRVNDARNVKPISIQELGMLFKKEFIKYGKPIAQLGPDAEAVMKDLSSDINIPFALNWNGKELELIAKTVMRKKNFTTPNKEFAVEADYVTDARTDNIFHELNESRMWKQLKQLTGLKMSKVAELMFEQLLAMQIFASADPAYAAQQAAQIMRLQNFDGFRTSQPDLYNVLTIMVNPERFEDRVIQDVQVTVPELRLKRNLRALAKNSLNNSDYGYMMLILQQEMQDFLPAPLVQLRRQVGNWDRIPASDKKVIVDRLMLQMRERGLQTEYFEKLRKLKFT